MTKLTRKLSCALVFVLMFAGTAAYAHEAVDLGRSGCSLTVGMKYGGKPVAGGSLTLYRVGSITENNGDYGFALLPELGCDADMDAPQSEKAAQEVFECVKRNNLRGTTAAIDAGGTAVFKALSVGLYLVHQETAAPGFNPIKPFLISVPQWDGERYVYDIAAASKAELHKLPAPSCSPQPPSSPNKPSKSKLPQTGQLNWPVPLLLAAGGALIIAGLIMRKKDDA